MRGNIITDSPGIKMRKYYKLYANKFNNLGEMEKFLIRHKLPKLPPEETYIFKKNFLTTTKEDYRQMCLMNINTKKIFLKILANQLQQYTQRILHMTK